MKLIIGADHRGFAHKEFIKQNFVWDKPIGWIDVGAYTNEPSDYPEFAIAACHDIHNGMAQKAILICGSGAGMAIIANRFAGIYAAVAWNEIIAFKAVEDDNVNVIVIPADFVDCEYGLDIVYAWLRAEFKHDHYQDRLDMIDNVGGVK
ncbi:MAG: RpiB/LacA/LacB family sugar-phosphate isomerase [Candidatus Babeliales bacterium]